MHPCAPISGTTIAPARPSSPGTIWVSAMRHAVAVAFEAWLGERTDPLEHPRVVSVSKHREQLLTSPKPDDHAAGTCGRRGAATISRRSAAEVALAMDTHASAAASRSTAGTPAGGSAGIRRTGRRSLPCRNFLGLRRRCHVGTGTGFSALRAAPRGRAAIDRNAPDEATAAANALSVAAGRRDGFELLQCARHGAEFRGRGGENEVGRRKIGVVRQIRSDPRVYRREVLESRGEARCQLPRAPPLRSQRRQVSPHLFGELPHAPELRTRGTTRFRRGSKYPRWVTASSFTDANMASSSVRTVRSWAKT